MGSSEGAIFLRHGVGPCLTRSHPLSSQEDGKSLGTVRLLAPGVLGTPRGDHSHHGLEKVVETFSS